MSFLSPPPPAQQPGDILTPEQIAKWLGVTARGVRWLAREKKIPHFRIGKFYRFRRQTIEQWIRDLEYRPGRGGKEPEH